MLQWYHYEHINDKPGVRQSPALSTGSASPCQVLSTMLFTFVLLTRHATYILWSRNSLEHWDGRSLRMQAACAVKDVSTVAFVSRPCFVPAPGSPLPARVRPAAASPYAFLTRRHLWLDRRSRALPVTTGVPLASHNLTLRTCRNHLSLVGIPVGMLHKSLRGQ